MDAHKIIYATFFYRFTYFFSSSQKTFAAEFVIPPELQIKQEPVDNDYPQNSVPVSQPTEYIDINGGNNEALSQTLFNHDSFLDMSTMLNDHPTQKSSNTHTQVNHYLYTVF